VIKYASTTHSTVEKGALKYFDKVGSAMLTILESMVARKTPVATAIKTSHLFFDAGCIV
jgi:hypothetical protein